MGVPHLGARGSDRGFDDDREAIKALVAAAKEGGFAQLPRRLRHDRAEATARDAATAELNGLGVRVIERNDLAHPGARLDNLGIPAVEHAGCPGHAAFFVQDWARAEQESEAGATPHWQPVYVCTDARTHGHRDESSGSDLAPRQVMTDEQKAERREVIERNKDWRAATEVRREWLAGFIKRTAAPKGAEQFIAASLLAGDHIIRQAMENHHRLLRELLGVPTLEGPSWLAGSAEIAVLTHQLVRQSARRQLVAVALLLAAWEDKTGVHTWRKATDDTRRYLGAMIAWGYEAGPLERNLVDE